MPVAVVVMPLVKDGLASCLGPCGVQLLLNKSIHLAWEQVQKKSSYVAYLRGLERDVSGTRWLLSVCLSVA